MLEELFSIVVEVVVEVAVQLVADKSARRWRGWGRFGVFVRALAWCVCGALLGGLSLLVFPDLLIKSEALRLIHLGASPVIAGVVMALIGRFRRNREKEDTDLETFAQGFSFALGFGLVRFFVAG